MDDAVPFSSVILSNSYTLRFIPVAELKERIAPQILEIIVLANSA